MKYWLILFHHKHGINHLVVASATEPDTMLVRDYLMDVHGADFTRDDESWEMEETSVDAADILAKK